MMGMKIGKGVMINSSNISDPCLIVLDDYVTIGGSAYMMAHYGMKGFLIIDKLHIKKGAMIGLAAKILGGVSIGERQLLPPIPQSCQKLSLRMVRSLECLLPPIDENPQINYHIICSTLIKEVFMRKFILKKGLSLIQN